MVVTFTGPDAFKFIGFTPKATAVLQANPFFLVILVLCLLGCIALGLGCFAIHLVTNRPYKKPKVVKDAKGAAPRK